jgi:hypothetical protein
MMHNEIHRTPEEIEEDINSFMNVVKQLGSDIHDNCDTNTCNACTGEGETPDLLCHQLKMDMFKLHQTPLEHKYEQAKKDIMEFETKADEVLAKYDIKKSENSKNKK